MIKLMTGGTAGVLALVAVSVTGLKATDPRDGQTDKSSRATSAP